MLSKQHQSECVLSKACDKKSVCMGVWRREARTHKGQVDSP